MENENKLAVFKKELECQELSQRAVSLYSHYAADFCDYIGESEITREKVIEYKKELENKYSTNTVNLRIVAINRFLRQLGYEKFCLKSIKCQRRGSLENVITKAEYRKLVTYAKSKTNGKYYAIIKTLAMTGIRINELKYITVEAVKKGYTVVRNKGKSREIYLTDTLEEILTNYCAKAGITTGVIFRGNTGSTISREAVWKTLKRYAKVAGIPEEKVYPHSFRHFFALSYMEKNSNLFELADILGHSDLSTTRIYTSSSIEDKRRRMGELEL